MKFQSTIPKNNDALVSAKRSNELVTVPQLTAGQTCIRKWRHFGITEEDETSSNIYCARTSAKETRVEAKND